MIKENHLPLAHQFIVQASQAGDIYSELKRLFLIEKDNIINNLAEELEIINNDFQTIKPAEAFITIDADTLNYKFNKAYLKQYKAINKKLLTINYNDFEKVCAFLLKNSGCDFYKVTKRSHDQGIDFFGTLPHKKSSERINLFSKQYVIGQAKYYTNPISSSGIREFVGSLVLLQRREFSSDNFSYTFATEINLFSQIQPVFITTSRFTKDAINLCNKVGIKHIDILNLCLVMASIDTLFKNYEVDEHYFEKYINQIQTLG